MAIYSYKESAIDDTIQTTDDIGVDLDQIEEDIMGKDGIEAHRDEIEYAEEEGVGDPLDEVATAIFESTYNMNQIIKCLELHNLNEASRGRELILEAVDIRGMFDKIMEVLYAAARKVMEAHAKFKSKMLANNAFYKEYVKREGERIRDGESKYDGKVLGYPVLMEGKIAYATMNIEEFKLRDTINAIDSKEASSWTKEDLSKNIKEDMEMLEKAVYKQMFSNYNVGHGADGKFVTLENLEINFRRFYFGVERMDNKKPVNISADRVIEILTDVAEIKDIDNAYNNVKSNIKALLSDCKAARNKAIAKSDNVESAYIIKTLASQFTRKVSILQTVSLTGYRYAINAFKSRRNCAFAIARAYASKSDLKKKNNKKAEPKQESASFFSQLTFE